MIVSYRWLTKCSCSCVHSYLVDKATLRHGQKKSLGTDDGFRGPGAACASSIVRVAHQIVNQQQHRFFSRGFTVANFDEADCDEVNRAAEKRTAESGVAVAPTEEYMQGKNMLRRGSKSLPASPMGSPKSVRKNPYFTGIFQQSAVSNINNSSEHSR